MLVNRKQPKPVVFIMTGTRGSRTLRDNRDDGVSHHGRVFYNVQYYPLCSILPGAVPELVEHWSRVWETVSRSRQTNDL